MSILNQIRNLSPEKLQFIPGPGEWSLSQVLTHVLTTERLSLLYMKKKSLGIDTLDDSGLLDRLKVVVLKISQRLPFRYKAPKAVVSHTPDALGAEEIVVKWETFLTELAAFLSTIEEKNVYKKIYKHPFLEGWMPGKH